MFPKVPKLPVVIPKGRTRPVSAAIAAKFASECNIAVRNWVPMRSHWNKYKGDTQLLHGYYNRVAVSTYCWSLPPFDVYMQMPACRAVHSYVCFTCHQAKFSMDITASPVKAACRKHLKKAFSNIGTCWKSSILIAIFPMKCRKQLMSILWTTSSGMSLCSIGWIPRQRLVPFRIQSCYILYAFALLSR